MLPCNMIRSPQPRPATSPSPRNLTLSPFSYTYLPILCLSPLPTSPNSTHPSQLDTPVPSQLLCYQSHPHAFRHTWGCASVFTYDFELSTPYRSFRKSPHQYHSKCFSFPLFSYSYALFCHAQNTNSRILNHPRTLCAKHPGWRVAALGSFKPQRATFVERYSEGASGRKYCVPLTGSCSRLRRSWRSSLRSTKSMSEVLMTSRSEAA